MLLQGTWCDERLYKHLQTVKMQQFIKDFIKFFAGGQWGFSAGDF